MGLTASHSERPHGAQTQYNSQLDRQCEPSGDQSVALQNLDPPIAEWPYKDSLRDLGYGVTVYAARRYEVAKYPDMTFYQVRDPNVHTDIGRFAAYTSPRTHKKETELVVLEINTRVGRRVGRPKAYEILAGFWEHTLRQDIRDLQRLYFDTVAEHNTVSVVRHHVCPLMQVAWQWHHHAPQADITLRRPDPSLVGSTAVQDEAWGLLRDESKLFGLANSLLSAYPQIAHQGDRFQIQQLDILPQPNGRGELFAFDLQVSFGVQESPSVIINTRSV